MASRNKFLACVDKIIEKLRDNNMALCEKLNLDYEDIKGEQEDEENQDGVDNDEQTSNEDDSVGESFVDGVKDAVNGVIGGVSEIGSGTFDGIKNAASSVGDGIFGKPEGSGSSENFGGEPSVVVSEPQQTPPPVENQPQNVEPPKDGGNKEDEKDNSEKESPKNNDGNVNGNGDNDEENLPAKKTWLSPAALAMTGGAAAATGIAAYHLGKKKGKKIRNSKLGVPA